jgi:FkbM family methyltransferase
LINIVKEEQGMDKNKSGAYDECKHVSNAQKSVTMGTKGKKVWLKDESELDSSELIPGQGEVASPLFPSPRIITFFHSGKLIKFGIYDETDHIQRFIASHQKFYEEQMLLDISRRLETPGLVIDVGANIGNHTVYLGLICNRNVIALEPYKKNFEILSHNVSLNNLQDKVVCLQVAAGSRLGRGDIVLHDYQNSGAVSVDVSEKATGIEVITLDSLELDEPPALIKIDVEGMEFDVLRGAKQLLKKHSPLLYVEVLNKLEYDKITTLLSEYGYRPGLIFNYSPTVLYTKSSYVKQNDSWVSDICQEYGYLAIDHMHLQENYKLKLAEVRELGSNLKEWKARAGDLEAKLEVSWESVSERDGRIETLEVELKARNTEVRELTEQLKEQEAQAEQLCVELKGTQELISESEERIETLEVELKARNTEVRELTEQLKEQEAQAEQLCVELKGTQELISESEERIGALEAELKVCDKRIGNLQAQLAAIYASRSWRITAPMRTVSLCFKWFLRNTRRAYNLLWRLGTGQLSRAIDTALSYYRRLVPERLRQLIPNKLRRSVLKFIERPSEQVEFRSQPAADKNIDIIEELKETSSCKEVKISVIMTSYNSAKYISNAIRSILNQTYQNLELIVVDDASTDGTFEILLDYARADKRVRPFKCLENRGTYWCKNFGITKATGAYITFQDSDDISEPDRLQAQIKELLEHPKAVVATCNYVRRSANGELVLNRGRYERMALISMMFRKDVLLDTVGYFDSVRTSADAELYHRLKLVFDRDRIRHVNRPLYIASHRDGSLTTTSTQVDLTVEEKNNDLSFLSHDRQIYVRAYQNWHETIKKGKSSPYMKFPLLRRHFPVPESLLIKPRHVEEYVTVSVASFAARVSSLKQTVESILPQVDRLNVYLNNYDTIPMFLKHPKIVVACSQEHGDLRDNGKFFFMDEVADGYHFIIDDDIIYPPDYVQRLILKILQYRKQAVVGVHGVILANPIERFYKDRTVSVFWGKQDADCVVNLLGTGTIAYHTSTLKLGFKDFKAPGMADLWFAIAAKRQKVPMVAVARTAKWLTPIEQNDGGLYEEYRKNDDLQTEVARQEAPWDFESLSGTYSSLADYFLSKFSIEELRSNEINVEWWQWIRAENQQHV